ncbi:MAG: glycosyltransferase [Verrucomicrobiota bacterium]
MTLQRIVYVLTIFPKLSETFIAGELAELRRRGIELRILSLLPPRPELQHGIIRRAGLDALTQYDVAKFEDTVKQFKPDLLHAHFAKEATEKARELSARTGVPFTFTAHGYDIHRKPPPDFRQRAAAARGVVTVSQANANYIHQTFGVPRERICVIPCGIDTERFCRAEQNQNFEVPIILCVARLVAVKNLQLLLDACSLLRTGGIHFRCVILGDGPMRAELEASCARLRLEQFVEIPGAAEQDDVVRWWHRAAVGALTSENEGMPVSLMEASACGVPVVATRVGGISELVQHGVTGLLSPAGDATAFASALEKILKDSALRQRMGAAARQLAEEKFSVSRQVDLLLEFWSNALEKFPLANEKSTDLFGAAADTEMPTLAKALEVETAWSEFKRRLPRLAGPDGKLRLKAIRVTRYKPARRCMAEYDVKIRRPGQADQKVTLIGKTRARRSGNEAYRLQDEIWNAGFDAVSPDGISVPEPIGVIAEFQMWFQRKVSGVTVEELISKNSLEQSTVLAQRVASAIHKLHRSNVPTFKQHAMDDELRILSECFDKVAALKPDWALRLENLLTDLKTLGANLPAPRLCGIHRDFYPAQVIVDGARLWLIDFDLYCWGDPALDVGNFIGHITEQALRERGDAGALIDVEQALENRFVELSGEKVLASVRVYTNLTLARHIFLSTRFPERARLTETLLELCEQRVRNT